MIFVKIVLNFQGYFHENIFVKIMFFVNFGQNRDFRENRQIREIQNLALRTFSRKYSPYVLLVEIQNGPHFWVNFEK